MYFLYILSIFCSINGFSSSGAFKFIDDEVITDVERFAREELLDLLKDRPENHDSDVMIHFFGEHESNPLKFQFSIDERSFIQSLVRYVNQPDNIDDAFAKMSIEEQKVINLPSSMWYFKDFDIEFDKDEQSDEVLESVLPFETHTHYVLNKLLSTANLNATRPKAGRRFDDFEVRQWATFLRMVAGPIAYETLQRNLELVLPSLSRMNHIIQEKQPKIIEGLPRFRELLIYLKERNLPLAVSLSEDGTRIEGRVQYDSKKNQLVGFVLPIDDNGMPIPLSFKAESTEQIVHHFCSGTPTSNNINTVMAKPIGNTPPFCLLAFGTNNKYEGIDVGKRWEYLSNNLKEIGIRVITISSDSDTKFNRAMRRNSRLGWQSDVFNEDWFKCGSNFPEFPYYVQDTPHTVGKMRNLLVKTMKYPELLQFGSKYNVQLSHIRYLLDHFPKDVHQLTESILKPEDKQNFGSVLRIIDSKVLQMLRSHVKESVGTVKYLELIKHFHDSYMDEALSPLQRVSKLWYSIFIVRIWRKYVLKSKHLRIKDNFFSHWTYSCLEFNAHAMILIILSLKKANQPELFKPWLYSSQPCENFYRQLRSLSTCFSQVTNCTIKEALDRIYRIDLQSKISSDSSTKFVFPEKLRAKTHSAVVDFPLPSKDEILHEIKECKIKAIDDAIDIGLCASRNVCFDCEVNPYLAKTTPKKSMNGDDYPVQYFDILDQLKRTTLKNFAEKFGEEPVEENSLYTEVFGGKKKIVIKKMSLCWLLRKNEQKLSSDRLIRVQNPKKKPKCKKRKTATVKHFSKRLIKSKLLRIQSK